MRRVVVLNDASVARGGATGVALASVRALRERGCPVTLICGDDGNNPDLAGLGVSVEALGERRLLDAGLRTAAFRGLYNRRTVAVVEDWISRNDNPGTIYHLHTWSKILSSSVFAALDRVRERLVISAHDFFLVCPNGAYVFFGTGKPCSLRPLSAACILASCDRRNYGHKLWRVARHGVQARLLRYRDSHPRVLAIHEDMRPILERGGIPPAAISTLRNPIRAWSSTRIAAEHNREFLFVGRLDEEKGPDLAARAARRAGLPLRIVGDGPMLASLREAYPEVIFSGQRSWEDVAAIAASARVLIMPSRYPEPFGLVAAEALWSGLPVIAASQALITPSIVAHGAGLGCDPRDEVRLAETMRHLADTDARIGQMSVSAFTSTRDLGLTPEAWIDHLLAVYRALCPEV